MAGRPFIALCFVAAAVGSSYAATITVNSTEDGWDLTPDRICETAPGNEKVTLLGAVQGIVKSLIPRRTVLPEGTCFLKPTWPATYGISTDGAGTDMRVTMMIEGIGPIKRLSTRQTMSILSGNIAKCLAPAAMMPVPRL